MIRIRIPKATKFFEYPERYEARVLTFPDEVIIDVYEPGDIDTTGKWMLSKDKKTITMYRKNSLESRYQIPINQDIFK